MYGVVLMMALGSGAEVPAWGGGCDGGGCHGGGLFSRHGCHGGGGCHGYCPFPMRDAACFTASMMAV